MMVGLAGVRIMEQKWGEWDCVSSSTAHGNFHAIVPHDGERQAVVVSQVQGAAVGVVNRLCLDKDDFH